MKDMRYYFSFVLILCLRTALSHYTWAPSPAGRYHTNVTKPLPTGPAANKTSPKSIVDGEKLHPRTHISTRTCDLSEQNILRPILTGVATWSNEAQALARPENSEGDHLFETFFQTQASNVRLMVWSHFQGVYDDASMPANNGRVWISCMYPPGYCEHDERRYTVTYPWQNRIHLASLRGFQYLLLNSTLTWVQL